MKIDSNTLSARSWAVPAISGLLVLHHDFKTPRLADVNRLVWSSSSVDVYLQYGICNLSGNVIDSIDIVVSLDREGMVAIRMVHDADSDAREAMLRFLAGEISREAFRWADELALWTEDEWVDADHASILSMVSALAAHPAPEMQITVEKDTLNRVRIRKLRLVADTLETEITPFGFYGVNLHVKGHGDYAGMLHLYQQYDMRQDSVRTKNPYARFLKKASSSAIQLMLLPLDMVAHLCEQRLIAERQMASDWVDYLPTSIVDTRAGEDLSALSE